MPVSLLAPHTNGVSAAALSSDRRYRYALERRWDVGPFAMFVMLNPSTANEEHDDATIRRCIGFAKRWGSGGILVGNLYAYRATRPKALERIEDPVGPDNDIWLQTMIMRSSMIVAAWGANSLAGYRTPYLLEMVRDKPLVCLGKTRGGHPRHPVRLPYGVELENWP